MENRWILLLSCLSFIKSHNVIIITRTETVYTFWIQKLYKMYSTFQQTFVYILYTKFKELWQLNFVFEMYTKVCRYVGYILYTSILYTFWVHQFWSTKSVHQKNYVYNLYTKLIQNLYTNNPTFQHILTRLLWLPSQLIIEHN